jgi:ribosomal protein L21E
MYHAFSHGFDAGSSPLTPFVVICTARDVVGIDINPSVFGGSIELLYPAGRYQILQGDLVNDSLSPMSIAVPVRGRRMKGSYSDLVATLLTISSTSNVAA